MMTTTIQPADDDGPPFQLESPPGVLWGQATMAAKFGVDVGQIARWRRAGKIPRPWIKNRFGEPFWAPEIMGPYIDRFRKYGSL
jgi:hypothetical protein